MRTIEKRQEMKPIEMKLARRLGGVGEYYFSKKLREIDRMRASGRQIINLGIGSPDRPPHPDVIGTLAAEAAKLPHVVFATTNKYTCSEPGQAAMKAAIEEHQLDRLVICSCSPRMHEATFRKMLKDTRI